MAVFGKGYCFFSAEVDRRVLPHVIVAFPQEKLSSFQKLSAYTEILVVEP